jgi:hypothetical protein
MSKIITYPQYSDYFRALSEKHKKLNPTETVGASHFYEFEEDFMGLNLKPLSMILLPPICKPVDDRSDNVRKEFNSEFWILKTVKKQRTSDRHAALEECEAIGWDLIKRIKKDTANYSLGAGRIVQYFDLSTVTWDQIKPAKHSDNYHGYSFEFTFSNNISIVEDEANWW